jgi:hypothetical protein
MNNDKKSISRRAVLDVGMRTLVGASLIGHFQPLSAAIDLARANSGSRALLCIYLLGGVGDKHLVVPGGLELHPAAAELRRLHAAGELMLLTGERIPQIASTGTKPSEIMAQRYAGLRFLPSGFVTPEWAAQGARLQGTDGGAYTFQGGLSMVSRGLSVAGEAFENAQLRRSMASLPALRTVFPDTILGRQLRDVTSLLRLNDRLGLTQPVFFCTAGGFTQGAARNGLLAGRYNELSQAVASFHSASLELGIEQRVTTYTDAEFSPASPGTLSARFIMGGAAMSPSVASGLTANSYEPKLTAWLGHAA